MHKVIEILDEAGATGALVANTMAAIERAHGSSGDAMVHAPADAIAAAIGVPRHLACLVSAPDNDPLPQDVPVRPDEEEPDTAPDPQTPQYRDSRAA